MEIPVFVTQLMADLTLQLSDFGHILFGIKYLQLGLKTKDREVNRRIQLFQAWGNKFLTERVEEAKGKIAKGEMGQKVNLIEAITMNSMKEKKEGELTYTPEDILGEFTNFFIAGVDTTSNFLVMMIYLIAQHPEVEEKVRKEIAEYMKEDDYSYDNLKNFTYIDCVEKEVTRFYGPVNGNFARVSVKDNNLKGVPISKDTTLNIQPIGLHYSEKYYKNPT